MILSYHRRIASRCIDVNFTAETLAECTLIARHELVYIVSKRVVTFYAFVCYVKTMLIHKREFCALDLHQGAH